MSICCAICCDIFKSEDTMRMEPVVLIKCHHVFHKFCIDQCLSSRKCPLCRLEFSTCDIKYHRLHFSYSPSSVIITNLLKEIEDQKRGKVEVRNKILAENIALKASLAEITNKFKAEKKKFQIYRDEIQHRASGMLRYSRMNPINPPNQHQHSQQQQP